jgi:hypothetical protein
MTLYMKTAVICIDQQEHPFFALEIVPFRIMCGVAILSVPLFRRCTDSDGGGTGSVKYQTYSKIFFSYLLTIDDIIQLHNYTQY